MHHRTLTLLFALAFALVSRAQHATNIPSLPGERWWGGATALGSKMPFGKELPPFNLFNRNDNNQVSPLLVSNKGRYVWSDRPFTFSVRQGDLHLDSPCAPITVPQKAGSTLRDAYLAAMHAHFPPSGKLPDSLFFTMPQYNTWIELMYNQNQKDVLAYAEDIVRNGFPPGIIMIDDNWQRHYGNFEFKPDRFPDPEGMVKRLHQMGFKVMLWVCPFVSADSPEYRDLAEKGFLLADTTSQPAIIKWWNGQSAVYDFTNPDARNHFIGLLRGVQQRYGIDGFKFDGGDNHFYHRTDLVSHGGKDIVSVDHTRAWAELGLAFPFNEYRAGWQTLGRQRLFVASRAPAYPRYDCGRAAWLRLCLPRHDWRRVVRHLLRHRRQSVRPTAHRAFGASSRPYAHDAVLGCPLAHSRCPTSASRKGYGQAACSLWPLHIAMCTPVGYDGRTHRSKP